MPSVYQLRSVLSDLSPLIWRRLLVLSDTDLGALHGFLQAAMGWSDAHLHRFLIHGKAYGIARCGGIGFADDPFRVRLIGKAGVPQEVPRFPAEPRAPGF